MLGMMTMRRSAATKSGNSAMIFVVCRKLSPESQVEWLQQGFQHPEDALAAVVRDCRDQDEDPADLDWVAGDLDITATLPSGAFYQIQYREGDYVIPQQSGMVH